MATIETIAPRWFERVALGAHLTFLQDAEGTAVPAGTPENSPAFQRRGVVRGHASPAGTAEHAPGSFLQPSLRDVSDRDSYPALKRRAILPRPSGTQAVGKQLRCALASDIRMDSFERMANAGCLTMADSSNGVAIESSPRREPWVTRTAEASRGAAAEPARPFDGWQGFLSPLRGSVQNQRPTLGSPRGLLSAAAPRLNLC